MKIIDVKGLPNSVDLDRHAHEKSYSIKAANGAVRIDFKHLNGNPESPRYIYFIGGRHFNTTVSGFARDEALKWCRILRNYGLNVGVFNCFGRYLLCPLES